jgi:hypothetical protein
MQGAVLVDEFWRKPVAVFPVAARLHDPVGHVEAEAQVAGAGGPVLERPGLDAGAVASSPAWAVATSAAATMMGADANHRPRRKASRG